MTQQSLTEPAIQWVKAGAAITCASCGIVFWTTAEYEAQRRSDHKNFYCSNGHGLSFTQETEAERYKRELRSARDNAARLASERDQAEASRRAWKGQTTRLRNRAAVGNCPFCGQHLRDLDRHIGRVHPDEKTRDLTEQDAAS